MAAIDIGSPAINRAGFSTYGLTYINMDNPANDTGIIDTIEVYPGASITNLRVGPFAGSGDTWINIGSVYLGSAAGGAKRTFTGLSMSITSGWYIGCYFDEGAPYSGSIDRSSSGFNGLQSKIGNQFGQGWQSFYYLASDDTLSLYGTGSTPPTGKPGCIAGKVIITGVL